MSETELRHYLANGQAEKPEAREALDWARETTAKLVDLKFCDLLGTWQHVTLPLGAKDEVTRIRWGGGGVHREA